MATKTFKIGLSATDKQNMAQDVYERVLDLTFEEYDPSETYNTGDFVVYNDALYQCKEDNVTGTWNSAKWQAATLQDLLDDVEGAVASVSGKANIIDLQNGTLVVAKAQVAEQIANVGEDVGSTQDEPFIFQATATNNGLDSVETAPIAKHLLKQGNSVVVNQYVKFAELPDVESSFTDGVKVSSVDKTNGIITITVDTGGATNSRIIDLVGNSSAPSLLNLISTHEYLMIGCPKNGSTSTYFLGIGTGNANWYDDGSGKVLTGYDSGYRYGIKIISGCPAGTYKFRPLFIDITKWGFTADEIDDITAHPEHFFNYYNGSLAYNEGTLTNCNGRYLKCIVRNQWDEETVVDSGHLDSKFIPVIPNRDYYFYVGGTYKQPSNGLIFYDKDNNVIKTIYYINPSSPIFTTPANCRYIKFKMQDAYGTTYNHDITISLYYSDGVGYDQYYPYEENVYDTGTETLLSAGSVRDYKTPDGTINHTVKNRTLTGAENETWTLQGQSSSDSSYYSFYMKIDAETAPSTTGVYNSITNLFEYDDKSYTQVTKNGYVLLRGTTGTTLYIRTNAATTAEGLKTWLSTHNLVINWEAGSPTTEQGTSFPENVIVDNYGSMGWLDTSENFVATPQGSQFFYPADYVEFLDSLYTRSKDGGDSADVTNIVVKSELTPFANQDTILQNAIGGTLRQLLASSQSIDFANTAFVDLETLNYTYRSADGVFSLPANTLPTLKSNGKVVCTLYKQHNVAVSSMLNMEVSTAEVYNTHDLIFKNTTYTNADDFKAAMKGVLLAYEKA